MSTRTPRTATSRRRFGKLARELHPDVNPDDPRPPSSFREASEAYEALSDADTRARYDRFGHAGVAGTQFHPEQFMDFSNLSDLLGAFFGDDLFGDVAAAGARAAMPPRRSSSPWPRPPSA